MQYGTHNIMIGDVLAQLAELPEQSVHCVVTSPPYWGLRDYGTATWEGGDAECDHRQPATGGNLKQGPNKGNNNAEAAPYRDTCGKCGARRIDQQIGLESTPDEFVAKMVAVFRAVRRVLRDDGTCWLNLGDSYASSGGRQGGSGDTERGQLSQDYQTIAGRSPTCLPPGLKPKDLCGIPWRVAFALQADGWYLRSDIIWSKPNPMPESVTDRPTKAHEYLFLLSKKPRYFYDADAVREPFLESTLERSYTASKARDAAPKNKADPTAMQATGWVMPSTGRNLRSVWSIPTQAYSAAHFATFPEKLVEPCVKAGTSEKGCCPECGTPWVRVVETETGAKESATRPKGKGQGGYGTPSSTLSLGGGGYGEAWREKGSLARTLGWRPGCECKWSTTVSGLNCRESPEPCVVLDPFCGSGTTLLVACHLGRDAIGIELSPEYARLAETRIGQGLRPMTHRNLTKEVDAPLFTQETQ